MKKLIIDKKLFEEFKNLKIGVIVCRNIDNNIKIDEFYDKFNEVKNEVKEKFNDILLSDYPVVREWRNIYKSFGEKKARSSIEALIRRIVNGNEIPKINPIVDIYNMISLKYELPIGGEDTDIIDNDVYLTYADGTESFIELGSSESELVNEGEIVYKYDDTVICRNFNYRESDITKLTEKTKNCILVIESVLDSNLEEALNELSKEVENRLNGSIKIYILDKTDNEAEI